METININRGDNLYFEVWPMCVAVASLGIAMKYIGTGSAIQNPGDYIGMDGMAINPTWLQ